MKVARVEEVSKVDDAIDCSYHKSGLLLVIVVDRNLEDNSRMRRTGRMYNLCRLFPFPFLSLFVLILSLAFLVRWSRWPFGDTQAVSLFMRAQVGLMGLAVGCTWAAIGRVALSGTFCVIGRDGAE